MWVLYFSVGTASPLFSCPSESSPRERPRRNEDRGESVCLRRPVVLWKVPERVEGHQGELGGVPLRFESLQEESGSRGVEVYLRLPKEVSPEAVYK